MPTFVTTIKFTERGAEKIRDTTQRAIAFKSKAEEMGAKVTDIFWTLGAFDGLIVFDAPDEETATAVMLYLGSLGSVQTQTGRAFRESELSSILSKLSD